MPAYLRQVCYAHLLLIAAAQGASAQQPPPSMPPQTAPHKPLADPNPSFDVATIKPTDPAHPGRYFRVVGRVYYAHDVSLADLIDLSYGVHPSQIADAPVWVRTEKFDVAGTQPGDDEPTGTQWLTMIRNFLTDRFALKLHREERDLPSYVLTIYSSGPKNLTPSAATTPHTSLEFSRAPNGLVLPARNAALGQFCQMMQQVVLDRPVIDRTGLTGKFDFRFTFMPNDSQFDGHPPINAAQIGAAEPAPDLFEALRTQLGLKLESARVPASILVIEHVERPAPN